MTCTIRGTGANYTFQTGAVIEYDGSRLKCTSAGTFRADSEGGESRLTALRREFGLTGVANFLLYRFNSNGNLTSIVRLPSLPPPPGTSPIMYPIKSEEPLIVQVVPVSVNEEILIKRTIDPTGLLLVGGPNRWENHQTEPEMNYFRMGQPTSNMIKLFDPINLIYYQFATYNYITGTSTNWSPKLASSKLLLPTYKNIKPLKWAKVDGASLYKVTVFEAKKFNSDFDFSDINSSSYETYKIGKFNAETNSLLIRDLAEKSKYGFIVEAYNDSSQLIKSKDQITTKLFSYEGNSYIYNTGHSKTEYSWFKSQFNSQNNRLEYQTFKYGPTGTSNLISREFLTFKKVPGAINYKIQWALGMEIPKDAPFVAGFQYSGTVQNQAYTSTTYITDQSELIIIGSLDDDLIKFSFPSGLWDELLVGNQVSDGGDHLRYYFRILGYDENNEAINYPTIGIDYLETGRISIEYRKKCIELAKTKKAKHAIIDIVSQEEALGFLDEIDSQIEDTWKYELLNHNTIDFYCSRQLNNLNNSLDKRNLLALEIFKDKLVNLEVGRDFMLRLDGMNDQYFLDLHGISDVIEYVLNGSSSEMYLKFIDALYISNVKLYKGILSFTIGRIAQIIDVSTGGNRIQIDYVAEDNGTKNYNINFNENKGGKYGLKFIVTGEDGKLYTEKIFIDPISDNANKNIHIFENLIEGLDYYYRVKYLTPIGHYTSWSQLIKFNIPIEDGSSIQIESNEGGLQS